MSKHAHSKTFPVKVNLMFHVHDHACMTVAQQIESVRTTFNADKYCTDMPIRHKKGRHKKGFKLTISAVT